MLASIALDERWEHLRDGAFVVKDEEREVKAFALDSARESRTVGCDRGTARLSSLGGCRKLGDRKCCRRSVLQRSRHQ